MYPLLVSGIASAAGSVLNRITAANERKAAESAATTAQMQAAFQDAMNRATQSAGGSPKLAQQAKLDQVRQALLDSPEIKTTLDSMDPTRLPDLSVSSDGKVTLTMPDGRTKTVTLSPDTQALAKEYASLQAAEQTAKLTKAAKAPKPEMGVPTSTSLAALQRA